MKYLILLLTIFLLGSTAFAQNPHMTVTHMPDSLKTRRLKHNDMQEADGIKMGDAKDIMENINHQPKFTTLYKAIRAAGFGETLKSNGPITLFAPVNDAFFKLPKGKLDTLMKRRHMLDMSAFIAGHAVPGRISVNDLEKQINDGKGKAILTTLGGCQVFATKNGDDVMITDEIGNKSTITTGNFKCMNGYIHVINGVLIQKPHVN